MQRKFATVVSGYMYMEAPRWHNNRIWFSDFYAHEVVSANEDGTDVRVEAVVPNQPSGLGWLPDGGNMASYAAHLLGEQIVSADIFDEDFFVQVDARRANRVLGATRWTNFMLSALNTLPDAFTEFLRAVAENTMPTVHGKKNNSAQMCLLMGARAAGWATAYSLAGVSQMTTKPGAGDKATSCKVGRVTLPAYALAHANWTHSHLRRPNRLHAEHGKTQAWSTTAK